MASNSEPRQFLAYLRFSYRVFQKSGPPGLFDDNFGKYGPILTFFTVTTRNL